MTDKHPSKAEQIAEAKNTPKASGTARKAPSGELLGSPSRNSVRTSTLTKMTVEALASASKRGRPRIGETRDKPWEVLGMSMRTWYRRQAEKREGNK